MDSVRIIHICLSELVAIYSKFPATITRHNLRTLLLQVDAFLAQESYMNVRGDRVSNDVEERVGECVYSAMLSDTKRRYFLTIANIEIVQNVPRSSPMIKSLIDEILSEWKRLLKGSPLGKSHHTVLNLKHGKDRTVKEMIRSSIAIPVTNTCNCCCHF